MRKIAFLVYNSWRASRRKNKSFDGMSNIGAYMLIDVLKRANIEVNFCSVDTAKNYDLILVSFTSIYDILAFARTVGVYKNWQHGKRKFIVLGGGFGMQNPAPIREWIDYAWFGRCENEILDLIKNLPDYEHPSLMCLDNITKTIINQSICFYSNTVKLNTKKTYINNDYHENILGCPNKCYFCHYTWARKYINSGNNLYEKHDSRNSQELEFKNYKSYNPFIAWLTLGLDGYSERIRYYFNKKISNDLFIDAICYIVNNNKIHKNHHLQIKLYNIIGCEIEDNNDISEFLDTLHKIDNKINTKVRIILHNTNLHPSPITPIAYSRINVDTNNSESIFKYNTFKNIILIKNIFSETKSALLESLSVERATEATQSIFDTIVFNKKFNSLKSNVKLNILKNKFDLTELIRQYNTNERLPSWFLESYVTNKNIAKLREKQLSEYNVK